MVYANLLQAAAFQDALLTRCGARQTGRRITLRTTRGTCWRGAYIVVSMITLPFLLNVHRIAKTPQLDRIQV